MIRPFSSCIPAIKSHRAFAGFSTTPAEALADHLVDAPSGYSGSVTSTKLKVSGIDVFSAGDFSGGDGAEDIVMRDAARGVYKRLVIKGDKLVGAVLYGDTADGSWYFDLLRKERRRQFPFRISRSCCRP